VQRGIDRGARHAIGKRARIFHLPHAAAQFALSRVAYVHIHFAKYGCYGARVDRAGTAPRVVGSATLP